MYLSHVKKKKKKREKKRRKKSVLLFSFVEFLGSVQKSNHHFLIEITVAALERTTTMKPKINSIQRGRLQLFSIQPEM